MAETQALTNILTGNSYDTKVGVLVCENEVHKHIHEGEHFTVIARSTASSTQFVKLTLRTEQQRNVISLGLYLPGKALKFIYMKGVPMFPVVRR